ncbi:MAG: GNAT family N-acetyltransferase [Actinobacteria bacterium]|nr:GNAT family N-acetyltransferase [Actinomycetota bacterium]
MNDPVVSVDRNLKLRILQLSDAFKLNKLIDKNRTCLRRWLPWLDHNHTINDTKKFIKKGLVKYQNNTGIELGIWYKNQLAGCIGLHYLNNEHLKTSIGYWLDRSLQGRGIMTKSISKFIDYLIDDKKINRIEIACALGNDRSNALPKRLGFTHEGIRRQGEWLYDHFVDLNIYSILADEWRSQKLTDGTSRNTN